LAAVLPVVLNPGFWAAVAEAAAWTAATIGAAYAGREAGRAIRERTSEREEDTVCIPCTQRRCPPCVPPVGSIGGRIDRVPPSAPHFPCTGDHFHEFIRNQNPVSCQCFWNKTGRVICLDQGGSPPFPFEPL
jgi:hypothetical protein